MSMMPSEAILLLRTSEMGTTLVPLNVLLVQDFDKSETFVKICMYSIKQKLDRDANINE